MFGMNKEDDNPSSLRRRAKLAAIRAGGIAFRRRSSRATSAAELGRKHGHLDNEALEAQQHPGQRRRPDHAQAAEGKRASRPAGTRRPETSSFVSADALGDAGLRGVQAPRPGDIVGVEA